MGVSGTIVLTLGPMIAKHILKSWLPSGVLEDLGQDLLDLVTEKVKENQQGRARADGEKLVEAMTAAMRRIYESSRLPNNEKQSVLIETARTLKSTPLGIVDVVDERMNAARLTTLLRASHPEAMRAQSQDAEALYSRLLAEAARAAIEVGSLLQSFSGILGARLLADNDALVAMLEKLSTQSDKKAQAFADKYRATVRRNLDRFEVFGLPNLDRYGGRQSLSVAYISLNVEPKTILWEHLLKFTKEITTKLASNFSFWTQIPSFRITNEALPVAPSTFICDLSSRRAARGDNAWAQAVSNGPAPSTTHTTSDIEAVLAARPRTVVRGQAGSGKSTLLQWLAVRAARGDFEGALSRWNNLVPFFIRLREYADSDFPPPEEFLAKVAPNLAGAMPDGWVNDVLETGRGLVLIDGVDELPQARRNAMLARLADLVKTYPYCRYVVSSRPAALKADAWPEWSEWTKREDFATASLRDMDTTLVGAFIDQWHVALGKALDGNGAADLSAQALGLKALLNGRPALRRLAKNPLLCAMICALYQERQQNLPNDRLELYRECVDLLLSRRDQGRRIMADFPQLKPVQGHALVRELAYWMLKNDHSRVDAAAVDKRFDDRLPALAVPDVAGADVRRYFVERTNLIREPLVGQLDFTHLTFQEYLAAQQACKESDYGLLKQQCTNDKWREVIILAAGLAPAADCNDLLLSLIALSQNAERPVAERKQLALLALACLETVVELDPAIRAQVVGNAISAIPPRDDDEAKLVASAGDPAIPLLGYSQQLSSDEATQCIKSLAMIGSEAAMRQLTTFAVVQDRSFARALATAWDSFDRARYAKTVLAPLTWIAIDGTRPIQELEHLQHLEHIVFDGTTSAESLLVLPKLPNLLSVEFDTSDMRILNALAGAKSVRWLSVTCDADGSTPDAIKLDALTVCPQLEDLRLEMAGILALEGLARLPALTRLSLSCLGEQPDLDALQRVPHLAELTLARRHGSLDLRRLPPLPKLRFLKLWTPLAADSFDLLARQTQLNVLDLFVPDTRGDLSALPPLPSLTQLMLSLGGPTDLGAISAHVHLDWLELTALHPIDLRTLGFHEKLEVLDLWHCTTITHLGSIARFPSLKKLVLPAQHGLDLKSLESLENLELVIAPD